MNQTVLRIIKVCYQCDCVSWTMSIYQHNSFTAAELEHININVSREPFDEAESSNFFTYFVLISALCIFFYVAMYNKKKVTSILVKNLLFLITFSNNNSFYISDSRFNDRRSSIERKKTSKFGRVQ